MPQGKYRFLIVSPGIEDGGMRGLGRVTFSTIDSLNSLGAATFLLTGAPFSVRAHVRKDGTPKKLAERRALDHYLAEGIKSSAFSLKQSKVALLLLKDLYSVLFGGIGVISNDSRLPAQHEPHVLRQFNSLTGYVNFSLVYKLSAKLPIHLRSYLIFTIAHLTGMDAIMTASPFPIVKPLFIGRRIKVIQFLHDVMPLNILETPPDSMNTFARDFTVAMGSANIVLTSSKNAQNKLHSLLPNTLSEVVYLPSEAHEKRKRHYKESIVGKDKRIKGKYMLFMSALEKRKNVARLFEAFSIISDHSDYCLVVVGSRGYGWDEIEATLQTLSDSVKSRIILKGYVTEEEKWSLLSKASFVVHPAIDEGLGIPVIESIIASKPVLVTRLSSVEEFTPKGTVVYIEDPYDVSEIADKMMHMIHDIDSYTQNAIRKSKPVIDFFSSYSFSTRLLHALEKIDIFLKQKKAPKPSSASKK